LFAALLTLTGLASGQGSISVTPEPFREPVFRSPALPIERVGITPVLADFNGDGRGDLVVADFPSFSLWMHLGQTGFSFAPPVAIPSATPVTALVAADVDGDGAVDLVVGTPQSVQLLLGNGDGTFKTPFTVPLPGYAQKILVADLNGDTRPDVVVMTRSASVQVLLATDHGTLEPAGVFQDADPSHVVFLDFAVGDFTGDGIPDVVLTRKGSDGTSTLVLLPGTGQGTWSPPASIPDARFFSSYPSFLAAADFDGDGRMDLAVEWVQCCDVFAGGQRNVGILRGAPGGVPTLFASGAIYLGAYVPLVAEDFDGDGHVDLAAFADGNNAYHDNWAVLARGNGNMTFEALVSILVGDRPYGLIVSDLDADGVPDLIIPNQGDANLYVLKGLGGGRFDPPVLAPAAFSSIEAFAAADFNRDGRSDLVIGDDGLRVQLAGSGGGFDSKNIASDILFPIWLQAADLDSDGNPDLIAVQSGYAANGIQYYPAIVEVLPGNGDGTFRPPVKLQDVETPFAAAVADVNGDGSLDIIIANEGRDDVTIYLGDGHGAFAEAGRVAVGPSPFWVAAADFNGDGIPDLATANAGNTVGTVGVLRNTIYPDPPPAGTGDVTVLLGLGGGRFAPPQHYAEGGSDASLAVGDYDQDGVVDLAVIDRIENTLTILLGNGDGSFRSGSSLAGTRGSSPEWGTGPSFRRDGSRPAGFRFSSRPPISKGTIGTTWRWPGRTASSS
jgi:hypothetical protein